MTSAIQSALGNIKIRPKTLAEVCARFNAGLSAFGPALAEFVDETKKMDAGALQAALATEPAPLDDQIKGYEPWQDAYIGAVAEHLARCAKITIPAWSDKKERFLSKAWFDNGGLKSLNAIMIAESPLSFRRRFIFTEAKPLRRA